MNYTHAILHFVFTLVVYLCLPVLGWGLVGAWTAMSLDMVMRGTFNFVRFRSGRWKSIAV